LEDGFIGLNGDGDWSLGDGSLELIGGMWSDVGVALHIDRTQGIGGFALLVNTGVWVVRLEFLTVGLGVDEGVLLPSTIATVGGGIAINELLLGKLDELTSGIEVGTLDGAGGREGPA